jgi:hypothetical protein
MSMLTKVKAVLTSMEQNGLDLPSFLYAASYGDAACTSDAKVQAAGMRLLHSPLFPNIL